MSILELKDVSYTYEDGTTVLKNISFTFDEGKIYAVIGRSGAGKTTLLSLLSGLAFPTQGKILFNDKEITGIDTYFYRSHNVGVIFQSYNLLPNLTALENVVLSMEIAGIQKKEREQKAMQLLEKVGLDSEEAHRRVLKLSGGQQQRVAIARALSYDPHIILADEPTGNLDEDTQQEIVGIFQRLAREENRCIVLVTHSPAVAEQADVVYTLTALKASGEKKNG